jgi:hypothetical protein
MYTQLRDLAVRLVPGVQADTNGDKKTVPHYHLAEASSPPSGNGNKKPDPDLSPLPGP